MARSGAKTIVITFLPFPDFALSAKSLDNARLGKQRGETLMILRAAFDPEHRYHNHIQVKMWIGFEDALISYGLAVCNEWVARGFKDETATKLLSYSANYTQEGMMPPWLGDERVHSSHRGRLIQKDWVYYKVRLGWTDAPCTTYFWPECP